MQARKVEVARSAGRRRLRVLLAALALATVVVLALVVLHSPLLAARHVTIVGAEHTSAADVLSVTGLDRRPPLVDVSTAADASAIDRLPWVERATVMREWPAGIRIAIVERHPVAEVERAPGEYALVDPTGRVLEDTTVRVAGVALLTGARDVPAPGGALGRREDAAVEAAGALPVSLLARVSSVRLGPGEQVVLQLTGGRRALLGPPSDLRAKMVSLATVLARVPLSGVVTIDLRVPADPVLTS